MRNWKRAYRLVAGIAGQSGFEIGEESDQGRALHIKFDLEKDGCIIKQHRNDLHLESE